MKNLSPIDENRDVVTKEYVDNATVASAEKLTSSAGSSTVPVYFEDGKPKVCAYTLGSMSKESASDYEKAAVIDEKFAAVKNDIAINRTTLGVQCKNLIDTQIDSQTYYGLTFKKNSDGSILINGTSTNTSTVFLRIFKTYDVGKFINQKFILAATRSDNVGIQFDGRNSSGLQTCSSQAYSVDAKFTSNANFILLNIYLIIRANSTFDNYTVYPMLRYADIIDDTYEPYQPSLIDRCLLKDTAGINLGHAQSDSITIDNLSAYTALWVNVTGAVSGIGFKTNLIVPIAYLAKSTSNSVQLAGGIPSSAYITSSGVQAAKDFNGTITAKISGNTLDLTISDGIIGTIEVVSLM